MKVVINSTFGGFSLSRAAAERLAEMGNKDAREEIVEFDSLPGDHPLRVLAKNSFLRKIPRTDVALLQVIEELGEKANGRCAALKVVDVPDDAQWEIDEYDGNEWVAEKHRRWS